MTTAVPSLPKATTQDQKKALPASRAVLSQAPQWDQQQGWEDQQISSSLFIVQHHSWSAGLIGLVNRMNTAQHTGAHPRPHASFLSHAMPGWEEGTDLSVALWSSHFSLAMS